MVIAGLTSVMIPKSESAEEIQQIDRLVAQLEEERGLPKGKIQFDLIIETALGVINVESVAEASPRIVQITLGQIDLSVDMGFPRISELNFKQYFYAESKLLYAARAANVQACGLGAQDNVHFTGVSMSEDAMLQACRHAFYMGYMGTSLVHPVWVDAANEGFKPSRADLDLAHKLKEALEKASERGVGSVHIDGRIYDMAHMKYINYILERAEAIARREAEKAAAMETARGIR